MADEAAVLDAPVLDVVDEVVEPVVEETAEATEQVAEPVEVKGDERVMPQWIKNLKATDPLGFKAAKADFFGKRALDEKLKDFDLDGTKGWLEEHGGREAIVSTLTELQGKAQELDGIASKMATGDPSLISDLIESSPEGFAKLAPVVAEQWAKADPEGWGKAMSGIMAATIQNSGIPSFLNEMAMMLKYNDTESFAARLQQLQEWAGSFQKQAATPVTPKQATRGPDVNQERQQWETEKFQTALRDQVESVRSQEIQKALDAFVSRRPKDTDAKDLAISNVRQQVIERMAKDTDFQGKLNALVARKDKDGAMRLIKSRETSAIQEIAPKVGRTIFGNPAQAVQPKTPVTPKAEAGFSFTDKPPRPELIDRGKTSDAMIMRGKFILKDGSRLTLEA